MDVQVVYRFFPPFLSNVEKKDLEPFFTQKMSRYRSRHFELIAFYKKKKFLLFVFLVFVLHIVLHRKNHLFCVFNLHVSTV